MRSLIVCLAVLALGGSARAQTSPGFEAADVHASGHVTTPSVTPFDGSAYAPNRMKGGLVRGGIYELRTASMVDLIRAAYGVDADAVTGGPAWVEWDRFDVIARVPSDTTAESVKPMLQALLAERFKLTVHNDRKPLPAYVLTAGKRPQLKEADGLGSSGCQAAPQNGYSAYSCHNVTMAAFAEALRNTGAAYVLSTPIIDRTGLKGSWDLNVKWTARGSLASAGAGGISLFDAIDKQLGLKLELQQIPMPVIVIDHVNRQPTDNAPGATKILPMASTEFEVANVKPSLAGAPEGGGVLPGGRIEMRGNTMKDFVKFAWNIDDSDDDTLVGGPKWLDEDRFDIVAKASIDQASTGQIIDVDTLRPMMKSLLLDRFKLKAHTAEQPVAVYALTAMKRNLKLKQADASGRTECKSTSPMPSNAASSPSTLTRGFNCHNVTMAQFAEVLRGLDGGYIDHPVIDATGIEGAWDFSVSFTPRRTFRASVSKVSDVSGGASDPTGAISLFEALDKQLGLKLEQQKLTMPVLVIDHVERKPTDN